jgi:hypothetical protein
MTPGPGNPHANGFFMKEVDLLTTHQVSKPDCLPDFHRGGSAV